jgi:hypothetical protein
LLLWLEVFALSGVFEFDWVGIKSMRFESEPRKEESNLPNKYAPIIN